MNFSRLFFLGLFCCAVGSSFAATNEVVKKLIEFGWDEPNTSFMRRHIAEMEKMPFDGCVFLVENNEKKLRLMDGWGKNAFTQDDFKTQLAELKSTHFHRFTHNFLRFNVTPGDVDWFDDFSAILNNARLAADIARRCKARGILFDIETYAVHIFEYSKQRDADKKSFNDYAAQCRVRGREVMNALQEKFPGITIFFTFGYSLPWAQTENGKKSLADCSCEYALLAPFLDGMVDAAKPGVKLVDGCELAYSFDYMPQFDQHYKAMRQDLLPIVADEEKYAKVLSAGFGLWLDFNSGRQPWSTNDFSKNHFPPHLFEASLRKALQTSDEYVWIYTERVRWWSGSGPVNLPQQYLEAVQKARKGLAKD